MKIGRRSGYQSSKCSCLVLTSGNLYGCGDGLVLGMAVCCESWIWKQPHKKIFGHSEATETAAHRGHLQEKIDIDMDRPTKTKQIEQNLTTNTEHAETLTHRHTH